MSIKNDRWIIEQAEKGMIEPFSPKQVKQEGSNSLISYGVSSYGYDVRCAREFKIFTNVHASVIDPKAFDPNSFVAVEKDICIIPPKQFWLLLGPLSTSKYPVMC